MNYSLSILLHELNKKNQAARAKINEGLCYADHGLLDGRRWRSSFVRPIVFVAGLFFFRTRFQVSLLFCSGALLFSPAKPRIILHNIHSRL